MTWIVISILGAIATLVASRGCESFMLRGLNAWMYARPFTGITTSLLVWSHIYPMERLS